MTTKQAVRDFISVQANKRLRELDEKIKEFHETLVHPLLREVIKEKVGDLTKLGDKMMKVFDGGLKDWLKVRYLNEYRLVNEINDVKEFTQELHLNIFEDLIRKMKKEIEGGTDIPNWGDERLDSMVLILQKDTNLKSMLADRASIINLDVELQAVINASSTGKVALKRLEELGVHTVSFVESQSAYLPAVINLSADVGLLNGLSN